MEQVSCHPEMLNLANKSIHMETAVMTPFLHPPLPCSSASLFVTMPSFLVPFTSCLPSPSCSSSHGTLHLTACPSFSVVNFCTGYGKWLYASAQPRCGRCGAIMRAIADPPQLYAGALYIHSNMSDQLGNAAPSPRLFLLQVTSISISAKHNPKLGPHFPALTLRAHRT